MIDKLRAAMTADAKTDQAEADLNHTARNRTVTITAVIRNVQGGEAPGAGAHAAGGIVSAMEQGGVIGMARGGPSA